jgi:hypothetical protein
MMPNHHRDVRATSKDWRVSEAHTGSAKVFVAPEVSPVATHLVEMAKGEQGWTDMDVQVPTVDPKILALRARKAARDALLEESQCGRTLPKARVDLPVAHKGGPSDRYREAKLRAARLAALEGTLNEW